MKAQDYYFAVGVDADLQAAIDEGQYAPDEISSTIVCMVHVPFWNEHHYLDDQHLGIEDIIPEYMSECMESHFESTKSPEETKKDLLALGFRESEELSKFLDGLGTFQDE